MEGSEGEISEGEESENGESEERASERAERRGGGGGQLKWLLES